MPVITIIAMADTGNHVGHEVWPTLEVASKIFDLSSFVLIGSLMFGAVATVLMVWMGIVKEHHWDNAREGAKLKIASLELQTAEAKNDTARAHVRIAELNNETALLREKGALTADAVLATAQATKANALAAQFLLALSQQLAQLMVPGMKMPGFLSLEQHTQIVSKVKRFAGKQSDTEIDITSSDLEPVGLLGSLIPALTKAGWVKVDHHGAASIDLASVRGVIINVDASKDSELLGAAETLASALNAEGIAAKVNSKTETDTINANVIHILVGPKP